MKRTLIFLIAVVASMVTSYGQDHSRYDEAVALLDAFETDSLKTYLEQWEAEEPGNAEVYALWLNYYYFTALEEVVEIVPEVPEGESAFALVDSTGNNAGYIVSKVVLHGDVLKLGYEKIDRGMALNPDRLDLYFGKAHLLLNASADYEGFISLIMKTFERNKANGGAWTWTFNEPMNDNGESFINSIQDYFVALYSIDDKEYASRLVDMALEAYPDNVMFLSDRAVLAFVAGDLQSALEQYLKVLEIAPDDWLVMANIANIHRDLNNIDEAVKYYTMLKESDDPEFAQLAVQALEELENQ